MKSIKKGTLVTVQPRRLGAKPSREGIQGTVTKEKRRKCLPDGESIGLTQDLNVCSLANQTNVLTRQDRLLFNSLPWRLCVTLQGKETIHSYLYSRRRRNSGNQGPSGWLRRTENPHAFVYRGKTIQFSPTEKTQMLALSMMSKHVTREQGYSNGSRIFH